MKTDETSVTVCVFMLELIDCGLCRLDLLSLLDSLERPMFRYVCACFFMNKSVNYYFFIFYFLFLVW